MKYTVTRACGHKDTVNLYGPDSIRAFNLSWMEHTICTRCQRKENAEKLEECTAERMPYREYKLNHPDCKIEPGSYDPVDKSIVVYVPPELDPDQAMQKRKEDLVQNLVKFGARNNAEILEEDALKCIEIGALKLSKLARDKWKEPHITDESKKRSSLLSYASRMVREYEMAEEMMGIGVTEVRTREWLDLGPRGVRDLLVLGEQQLERDIKLGKAKITQQITKNMIMGYLILEILSRDNPDYQDAYDFAQKGLDEWIRRIDVE